MDKENKESFIRRSSRYFAVTFSPLQSDDRRGEDCSDRGHRSEYTRGGGTQHRFTFNVNFKGKDRIHVDRFNVCPGFPLPLSVARGRNPRWQNGKDDAIFRINTPWCTRLPSLPSLLSTAPRHCTLRFSLRVPSIKLIQISPMYLFIESYDTFGLQKRVIVTLVRGIFAISAHHRLRDNVLE